MPRFSTAGPLLALLLMHAPGAAGQAFSPPTGAQQWAHGSVPSTGTIVDGRVATPVSLPADPLRHNAEVHWYSPRGVVTDADLDPTLTDDRGARNRREVLAISVPRRPVAVPDPSIPLWISLTHLLDPVGLDVTGWEAIELWVNDWRDVARVRGPGLRLHLDLGHVSEDQMRAPNLEPNRSLDSEDRPPRDRVLGRDEDTGTDGRSDLEQENALTPVADLVTASAADPMGDDYAPPVADYAEIDPRRWIRSNGTEGNRLVSPLVDSEDLDFNYALDLREAYFEYTIDLSEGSTRYLVTDVYQQFAGQSVPHPPAPDNGWRRYRIPIDDPERVQFGEPDLRFTQHLRIWVDGIVSSDGFDVSGQQMRPLLMLAGVERTPDVRERIGSGSPNPFVTSTTFAYRLQAPTRVRAVVLDLQGREVAVLEDGNRDAGYHALVWNGLRADGHVAHPGMYFVRARIEGHGDRLWRVVRLR